MRSVMRGSFIVFEGIDGAGKSTVCRGVASTLERRGMSVDVTAEPTHEGIGAFIRSGGAGRISQRTEALLFVADRNDHTEHMMRAVSEGRIVLCDRYAASTIAYQSAKLDGDGTDWDWLVDINSDFIRRPDAVILLDIDPEKGMSRVGTRGEEISKFEDLSFLKQVRENYLRLADLYGYHVVDASKAPEDVLADVMEIIDGVV